LLWGITSSKTVAWGGTRHGGGGCTQSAGNGSRAHGACQQGQQACDRPHVVSSPWSRARLDLAARSHNSAPRNRLSSLPAAAARRQPRVRVRWPASSYAGRRGLDVLEEAGEKEGQFSLFIFPFYFFISKKRPKWTEV
jgi:hypothetical protein